MPKLPKPPAENGPDDVEEKDGKSWEEDQKKREYYYDDAHGYTAYKPDQEEEESDLLEEF